jgi:hypothetical protein
MRIHKSLLGGIAGLAAAAAIALTPVAAFAAPGAGHGAGGGTGGGGTGKTESVNNLSVPAVFVGSPGFGLTNPELQPPTGDPAYVTTTLVPGYYYIQGLNKWQAQYQVAASATATAKWGDNLAGGSASLRTGNPIRVEMALTSDTVSLQGYNVIKLNESLADRASPYGTLATLDPATGLYSAAAVSMPARVWASGVTLTIAGPSSTSTVAMPGEINATGAVVFGYNWRPSEPGGYLLTFNAPSGISITGGSASITVMVKSGSGGGR